MNASAERLAFVDVDDTLLTPPYDAVRRVSRFLGKDFPARERFLTRPHVDYHKAFPGLFRSPAEMWAVALLSLPFGHFRSQSAMPFEIAPLAEQLRDHRVYLLSKNPPSFTRWRVQRLEQIFGVRLGDRYIACGPILRRGRSKLSIMQQIAGERGVPLESCLLVDDSGDNVREAAAAGVACALVRASWNAQEAEALQRSSPRLQIVDTTAIAQTLQQHMGGAVEADGLAHFVVPPLSLANVARLGWTFLRRWWSYAEPFPGLRRIVPVARNPLTSLLYQDPQAAIGRRLQEVSRRPHALVHLRVLPLGKDSRPLRLPVAFPAELTKMADEVQVRTLRTVCRDLLKTRGHRFVRDAMFYFTELNRLGERKRVLSSARVAEAKRSYAQTHGVSPQKVDALAEQYADELLTSRSYVSCLYGERVLDTLLGKLIKKVHLQAHPMVRALEKDHFLLYAATHRSYLDSAVLWALLSHHGQSFPFAVGADKMRTVWFGRLGVRGGTFFIKRRFVDGIYAAIIGEHMLAMQKPGSVLEVFLEGQRSRSGLTLPPKKGIVSIAWENMGPHSKVALVPVSFTYNKIPESEKLIQERFDERQKLGATSLRERADMQVRQAAKKSRYDRLRATWRRLRSPAVSECFVHYAEPIVLDRSADKAGLQGCLNEAMLRMNSSAAILPSSVLCLCVLGADDGHATFAEAVDFLGFSAGIVALYRLPGHLRSNFLERPAEGEVRAFAQMPFVNRKFKRVGLAQAEVLCIDALDIDRASYYKNNVLHFFVLPAILSYVLTDLASGRIEELHRCFDHMFAKLQTTYFLPTVESTPAFIDTFLRLLTERGLLVVADNQWVVDPQRPGAHLLRILSRVGAEVVQGDLPRLLDAIRRSSQRMEVKLAAQLAAVKVSTCAEATATLGTEGAFVVQADAEAQLGDRLEFVPQGADARWAGVVVGIALDGVSVRLEPASQAQPLPVADGMVLGTTEAPAGVLRGTATLCRAQAGEGTITNLSPSGAFVVTSLPLRAGDRLACAVGGDSDALRLNARVVRATAMGVGVSFEDLSEGDKAKLALLSMGAGVGCHAAIADGGGPP